MKKTIAAVALAGSIVACGNLCLLHGATLRKERQEKISRLFSRYKADKQCVNTFGYDFLQGNMDREAFAYYLDSITLNNADTGMTRTLATALQSFSLGIKSREDAVSFLAHSEVSEKEARILRPCLVETKQKTYE